ncbi:MAG: 3-deoxy-manno-octulosonate cytidylyltransferase [Nitrospinota bacterium]
MSVVAVIPARYASTRFPGKPLAPVGGKPLVQHVYERVSRARYVEEVWVATDDGRIRDAVEGFGAEAVMTSPDHPSGMDRIAEAVAGAQFQWVVNVQADEPLIAPGDIDAAVLPLLGQPDVPISTLAKRIQSEGEFFDPNVVKVALDAQGFALYFSRSPIPYNRAAWERISGGEILQGDRVEPPDPCFKHIGLYVYRREVLTALAATAPTPLEVSEGLEQLRALESGYKILVVETVRDSIGVDVPEDVQRVEELLKA